jgi:hypothetical protein
VIRLRRQLHRRLTTFGLFAASALLAAASELDPVPTTDVELSPTSSVAGAVARPVQRTILATRPAFNYSFMHIEGVLAEPGIKRSTSVHSASVSLHWNLGEFIMLRYHPSWTHYSTAEFDDNFGHDATALWQRRFVDWNARASHTFRRASLPLVETGQQTHLDTHVTTVEAQRPLGARTTLELGLRQHLREAESFSSNKEWSTEDWLHYQLTSSVAISGGIKLGYVEVDQSPDMDFRQLRGRVRWLVSEKIHLDAQAGVERRGFTSTGVEDADTPVFGGSFVYRILETTTFSLSGDRSVAPSYFQNQVNRSVTWQAGLAQRLLGRFQLEAYYVRRDASFHAAATGLVVRREDDGESVQVRIRTGLFNRGTIGVFYQHRTNDSTDALYDFSGNQWGLDIGFSY